MPQVDIDYSIVTSGVTATGLSDGGYVIISDFDASSTNSPVHCQAPQANSGDHYLIISEYNVFGELTSMMSPIYGDMGNTMGCRSQDKLNPSINNLNCHCFIRSDFSMTPAVMAQSGNGYVFAWMKSLLKDGYGGYEVSEIHLRRVYPDRTWTDIIIPNPLGTSYSASGKLMYTYNQYGSLSLTNLPNDDFLVSFTQLQKPFQVVASPVVTVYTILVPYSSYSNTQLATETVSQEIFDERFQFPDPGKGDKSYYVTPVNTLYLLENVIYAYYLTNQEEFIARSCSNFYEIPTSCDSFLFSLPAVGPRIYMKSDAFNSTTMSYAAFVYESQNPAQRSKIALTFYFPVDSSIKSYNVSDYTDNDFNDESPDVAILADGTAMVIFKRYSALSDEKCMGLFLQEYYSITHESRFSSPIQIFDQTWCASQIDLTFSLSDYDTLKLNALRDSSPNTLYADYLISWLGQGDLMYPTPVLNNPPLIAPNETDSKLMNASPATTNILQVHHGLFLLVTAGALLLLLLRIVYNARNTTTANRPHNYQTISGSQNGSTTYSNSYSGMLWQKVRDAIKPKNYQSSELVPINSTNNNSPSLYSV